MLFSSKVSTGVCWVAFQDNFSRLLILFIAILEKGKTEHFNYKTINSMNKNCFFFEIFFKNTLQLWGNNDFRLVTMSTTNNHFAYAQKRQIR
jgi:hypothetical protein